MLSVSSIFLPVSYIGVCQNRGSYSLQGYKMRDLSVLSDLSYVNIQNVLRTFLKTPDLFQNSVLF